MAFVNENEFTFKSSDLFTDIHVHEWIPDCDLNGVVQISHGVNEYVERYSDFARYLASKGFVVVGNDHLGHGQSVFSPDELGFFAYNNGWEKVVMDIEKLRKITAEKHPDIPYFILGHSMGSFLLRTHLIEYPDSDIYGAIISGTGQQPKAMITAGRLLSEAVMHREGKKHRSKLVNDTAFGSYNKKFEPKRTDFDWLSRDENVVDNYVDDPFCGAKILPTVSLFRDMMGGLAFIQNKENLQKMNTELYAFFMSGSMDPVGDYGVGVIKSYSSFREAGLKNVSYKLYPEGRHEMLNEINKSEVYNDILNWLFYVIQEMDGF